MSTLTQSEATVPTVVTDPLEEAEARHLTERIKETAGLFGDLLVESQVREAHLALGYATWNEYAESEFTESLRQLYRRMDQARFAHALNEAAGITLESTSDPGVTSGQFIDEKTTRRLKPSMPAVLQEVRDAVADGVKPQEAVRRVVAEHGALGPKTATKMAQETGVVVPATDGLMHDGRTEEEETAIGEGLTRAYTVYNALHGFATMSISPQELIEEMPFFEAYKVDDFIEAADAWFQEFKEAWRKRDV